MIKAAVSHCFLCLAWRLWEWLALIQIQWKETRGYIAQNLRVCRFNRIVDLELHMFLIMCFFCVCVRHQELVCPRLRQGLAMIMSDKYFQYTDLLHNCCFYVKWLCGHFRGGHPHKSQFFCCFKKNNAGVPCHAKSCYVYTLCPGAI